MAHEAVVGIRAATSADLSCLQLLYGQLNPEDPAMDPADAVHRLAQVIDHPGLTVFIAEVEGFTVSSVTLVVIPNLTRNGAPYALIENVITHADHRNHGHARTLIEKAVETAWEAGCYKVMLLTGSKEEATLRFYANCGFSQNKTGFQIRRP